MLCMGLFTIHVPRLFPHGNEWWLELVATLIFICVTALVISVVQQPKHRSATRNSIPCVPLLPICAIWMDIHLAVCLPYSAWLAFVIWGLIGKSWLSLHCSTTTEWKGRMDIKVGIVLIERPLWMAIKSTFRAMNWNIDAIIYFAGISVYMSYSVWHSKECSSVRSGSGCLDGDTHADINCEECYALDEPNFQDDDDHRQELVQQLDDDSDDGSSV